VTGPDGDADRKFDVTATVKPTAERGRVFDRRGVEIRFR
jgi:hypothetical protein